MDTVIIRNGDTVLASEIIKRGGLAAVPTETVYGLSANGLDSSAVKKIYEVKGRPSEKPVSLLVSGMDGVLSFCTDIPECAFTLAEKFWPGPLTMVLRKSGAVPDIVTASGNTVGVRCPDHELTLDIIKRAGVPLAAPSANLSGMASPKTADEVISYFDGKIDCIVDGGPCSVGVESTILDLTVFPARILRPGGVSARDLEQYVSLGV